MDVFKEKETGEEVYYARIVVDKETGCETVLFVDLKKGYPEYFTLGYTKFLDLYQKADLEVDDDELLRKISKQEEKKKEFSVFDMVDGEVYSYFGVKYRRKRGELQIFHGKNWTMSDLPFNRVRQPVFTKFPKEES